MAEDQNGRIAGTIMPDVDKGKYENKVRQISGPL